MPTPPGVGSENLANAVFVSLVGAQNANLPFVDIFDAQHDVPWGPSNPVFSPVEKVTLDELMLAVGTLQQNFRILLEEQVDKQRITNADYAKTFVALSQVATQGAVQFVLGKDTAYWTAVKNQAEALTARMQNERLRMEVMLLRAQFARTKLELANTDSQFGVSELQRTELLPSQVSLAREQYETARAQTLESRSDGGPVTGVIGGQKLLTAEQRTLVHEQMEAQRAQTVDGRLDGQGRLHTHTNPDGTTEVRLQGLLGVQTSLYNQQINSYREDGKVKAGKLFSDLWMTMKTIDEGVGTPTYIRPPIYNNDGTVSQTTPLDKVFQSVRRIALGNMPDDFVP